VTRRILPHIAVFITFVLCWTAPAAAGLFDNDEENWKKIFEEVKKINARLVEEIGVRLKSSESIQQDLARQVEEIKQILPGLQASIDQNKSDINKTLTRLNEIEAGLNKQLAESVTQQKQVGEILQGEVASRLDQMKNGLAQDMENLSKRNQEQFGSFATSNQEAFKKVADQLASQNLTLQETQKIFKEQLIPAVRDVGEKNREVLLTEINRANQAHESTLKANQILLASIQQAVSLANDNSNKRFDETNKKNQTLIELLKKILEEEQKATGGIQNLEKGLVAQGEETKLNRDVLSKLQVVLLKEIDAISAQQKNIQVQADGQAKSTELIQTNLAVADEKIKKLAEGVNALHGQNLETAKVMGVMQEGLGEVKGQGRLTQDKFNTLIDSSKEILTHSTALEQKLDLTVQKADESRAQLDVSNQKLSKLIEILKTIAAEQGKLESVVQSQNDIKGMQQSILGARDDNLKQILDALKDLRNKANVNIDRNENILKKLEDKKSSASAPKAPRAKSSP